MYIRIHIYNVCCCNCLFYVCSVARIEEEKLEAKKEGEELLANFEQHQVLEKQQQEEKRKVKIMLYINMRCRHSGCMGDHIHVH